MKIVAECICGAVFRADGEQEEVESDYNIWRNSQHAWHAKPTAGERAAILLAQRLRRGSGADLAVAQRREPPAYEDYQLAKMLLSFARQVARETGP